MFQNALSVLGVVSYFVEDHLYYLWNDTTTYYSDKTQSFIGHKGSSQPHNNASKIIKT